MQTAGFVMRRAEAVPPAGYVRLPRLPVLERQRQVRIVLQVRGERDLLPAPVGLADLERLAGGEDSRHLIRCGVHCLP